MTIGTYESINTSIINDFGHDINVINLELVKFIENKIHELIIDDEKLDIPVFSFINNNVISKIAYFLSGAVNRSIAIGVAGETASGKSTFTKDCLDQIIFYQNAKDLNPLVTRLNTDDYYYDRSEMVKELGGFQNFCKVYDLDIPEAFELSLLKKHIEQLVVGNEVWLPKYDMSGTAIRNDNHSLAQTAPIIVTEGLFTLTDTIKDVFDICIYVDVSKNAQEERFFKRAEERGLGASASKVLENAVNKAEIHIRPTKINADVIINGEAARKDYINMANKFIRLFEEIKNHNKPVLK